MIGVIIWIDAFQKIIHRDFISESIYFFIGLIFFGFCELVLKRTARKNQ